MFWNFVFLFVAVAVAAQPNTCTKGWNAVLGHSFCTVSSCTVNGFSLPSEDKILAAWTFHESQGSVANANGLSIANNSYLQLTSNGVIWKNSPWNVTSGIRLNGGYLVSANAIPLSALPAGTYDITVFVSFEISQRPSERSFANVFSIGPGGTAGDHDDIIAVTVVDKGDTVWYNRAFNGKWRVSGQSSRYVSFKKDFPLNASDQKKKNFFPRRPFKASLDNESRRKF